MGTIKSEVAFQTTSASRVKFVRIFVFVVAGMAGLLFGLDQGVISGALPFIAKEWELTSRLQEWGSKFYDGRCSYWGNYCFKIIFWNWP